MYIYVHPPMYTYTYTYTYIYQTKIHIHLFKWSTFIQGQEVSQAYLFGPSPCNF